MPLIRPSSSPLSIFNQVELRQALHPYLFLTQAVRNGSIQRFNEVSPRTACADCHRFLWTVCVCLSL